MPGRLRLIKDAVAARDTGDTENVKSRRWIVICPSAFFVFCEEGRKPVKYRQTMPDKKMGVCAYQ